MITRVTNLYKNTALVVPKDVNDEERWVIENYHKVGKNGSLYNEDGTIWLAWDVIYKKVVVYRLAIPFNVVSCREWTLMQKYVGKWRKHETSCKFI